MSEPAASDLQLVQRIRELVADEGKKRRPAGPVTGWVPAEPPSLATPMGMPAPAGATTARQGWVPAAPPSPAARPQPPPVATTGGARTPRVLPLPGFLRGARLQVGGRAVLALVAVVLAAGLVFAARVAAATSHGEPVTIEPNASGRAGRPTPASFGTSATTAAAASSASPTGGGAGLVQVHVVGQVATPRVVTLAAGSRVADAVTSAGGALPSADLARVNLARPLADGEQVHVPAPGEMSAPAPGVATATAGALVDLNTADLAALDSLPGVGPVLAQRIVDWRTTHGRFSTVEELGEVSGIGDKLLAQVRPKVTVGSGPRR